LIALEIDKLSEVGGFGFFAGPEIKKITNADNNGTDPGLCDLVTHRF
jgi:hypothetical protein